MEKQDIEDKLENLYKERKLAQDIANMGSLRHQNVILPIIDKQIKYWENELRLNLG